MHVAIDIVLRSDMSGDMVLLLLSVLLSQEWETKPRRGRQRKAWGRVVDELFVVWISMNGWRILRGERVH